MFKYSYKEENLDMNDFLNEYKNSKKLRTIAMIPFIIAILIFAIGVCLPYYQVTYENGTINFGLFSNTHSVNLGYFIGVLLALFVIFSIVMNFDLRNKNMKLYFIFPLISSIVSIISIVLIYLFAKPSVLTSSTSEITSEGIGAGSIMIFVSLILSSILLIAESMLLYKINNGWTNYRSILKIETPVIETETPIEDYYDLDEVRNKNEELGIIETKSVCPVCGNELHEDDAFCPRCGTKISDK